MGLRKGLTPERNVAPTDDVLPGENGAIPRMFPDMPPEEILDKAFGESRLGIVAASL